MEKNRLHKDFTQAELKKGYVFMIMELEGAPAWLRSLFFRAWVDFQANKFSYDGATFVRERSGYTLFEVAAFLHDWLNGKGIVSYEADRLMFRVMKILGYKKRFIIWRYLWTRLTIVNIWRHKIKGTYKGKFAIELIS